MTNCAHSRAYNFCMETIYIDRLFIINLICDYLMVLGSARVCGLLLRRWRYALAALFGAIYAVLSVFPSFAFLTLLPIKLAAGILMALIAFANEPKFLRCAAVFFAVSALFGGTLWAVSAQSGPYSGGAVYLPISMPVLVLSFGIIYAAMSVVFRRTVKSADKAVCTVRIEFLGKSVTLRALYDSGNCLYDPMTGSAVLIAGADRLAPLFPTDLELFKNASAAQIVALDKYAGKMRLIPYSVVGTERGLLPAFKPDKLSIDAIARDDIVVAVSPTPISGDGFDCII